MPQYWTQYPSDPARHAEEVTTSDTVDLAFTSRSLYIGTSGDVTVLMAGTGAQITFSSVPVGTLPVSVTRVLATGTTAQDIVALY
jgi:hypothetical protein